jgi:hypothetical protein
MLLLLLGRKFLGHAPPSKHSPRTPHHAEAHQNRQHRFV